MDEDNKIQPSVTIKLAKKANETYRKFDGGTPAKIIRHIMTFHNLALKLECRENYECYKQVSDDNKAKITALGTIDANTDESVLKEKEAFESKIDIAQCEMNEAQEEYWLLFECLLHLSSKSARQMDTLPPMACRKQANAARHLHQLIGAFVLGSAK